MPSAAQAKSLDAAAEELHEFMTEFSGCLPWDIMNHLWDVHSRMVSGYQPRPEDQAVILTAMMRVQRVNRYGK